MRRRPVPVVPVRPLLALAAVLALAAPALTACGDATPDPPSDRSTTASPPGEWTRQPIAGSPGSDHPAVLVADDERGVLVAFVSDDGVLQSSASPDGTALVEGDPLETGLQAFGISATAYDDGWFALGSGGIGVVDGDEQVLSEPHGFRSADGLSWERVVVDGIGAPVDIGDVTSVGDTLVASGAHRPADSNETDGFRAAVWTSRDGTSWTEAVLPGAAGAESYAADLAVSGERVLVVGRVGRTAALWASDDAGATWTSVEVPALRAGSVLGGLAATEAAIVVTAQGAGAPVLRSTDQGRTWSPAARPPPAAAQEDDFPASVEAGGGRFFATTSVFRDAFSSPEVCYASIELCQQDSSVSLYTSEDGDTWSRVDTSGIGTGEEGEVDHAVGAPGGGVVVLQGWTADGPAVSTWPAGTTLPLEAEPTVSTVELVEPPRAGPEPGVRYHAPLYVHCGMDHLYLGDSVWRRTDDGPDVETGAGDSVPADWPVAQQTVFGFATLVEPDLVEYSLEDGRVVARYAPTSTGTGCD